LIRLKSRINKDKKKVNYFIKKNKDIIKNKFNIKIEYLEARNTLNLNKEIYNNKYRIFIAYYLNNVRLIDNF
jgi:pantoate--beta-alanine ligase